MNKSSKDTILQELKATAPIQLLAFLEEQKVRKSRTAVKSLLAHKQITVNGKIVSQYDFELKNGDAVLVMKYNQARRIKRLKGLSIVFEDDDIIVIDKEPGLLSVSTDKEKQVTAYGILNEYVKRGKKNVRIFVLHRLDREASGLILFAKSAEVQELFQANWVNRVPLHSYVAVVEGVPVKKKGSITSWLTENKNFLMFSSPTDNGGNISITHYETIKTNGRYSLLSYSLETKRKNQIRVQMSHIGHPIVGDKKYGATSNPIKRIALHAHELTVVHPMTGDRLEFKSNIPKGMLDLLSEKQALTPLARGVKQPTKDELEKRIEKPKGKSSLKKLNSKNKML